jgi:hypothetical protein
MTPMIPDDFMYKRLRIAGILIAIGLIVEAFSLIWNHPLSFLAFLGIGGLLLFLGVAVYLTALVTPRKSLD